MLIKVSTHVLLVQCFGLIVSLTINEKFWVYACSFRSCKLQISPRHSVYTAVSGELAFSLIVYLLP